MTMSIAPATPREDRLVGRLVLRRFRVVRRLAVGGMGTIYLARTEGAEGFVRPVVVKRILPHLLENEEVRTMFVREARILSRLRHPGIVGIQDFAYEDDAYVMVLEYVHGFTLAKWARYSIGRRGGFPSDVAVELLLRVLEALDYAHGLRDADGTPLGIVHRDVTPSNVLIDVNGDVKLADFGIARVATEATHVGDDRQVIKGKFAYLAPELFDGAAPTPSSDVYSCGVVLHQVLVGRNEFRGDDPSEVMARVLRHVPTRLDAVREDVPPALADAVAVALAKRPNARYTTARDFADALRATRLVPSERSASRLRALVEEDFRDPRMPQSLGLPPLEALERAWLEPPPSAPDSKPSEEPTRLERPALAAGPPAPAARAVEDDEAASVRSLRPADEAPRGSRRETLILAFGAGAVLALGAALVVALRPAPSAPPPVLVVAAPGDAVGLVDLEGEASPQREPMPEEPPAGEAGADPAAGVSTPTRPTPNRPLGPERRITRAFGRHQSELARCMTEHAATLGPSPSLSVRLEVAADGSVRRAEVLPPELGATPLGRCVVGVSRQARFDASDGNVTVRIPLRLRRSSGASGR